MEENISKDGAVAGKAGVPAPGFSDRVNSPEILAALAKQRRATRIFGIIVILIAFAAPAVYASVTGKMEMGDAIKMGGVISGAIIICSLVSKIHRSLQRPYEAVVIDKQTRRVKCRTSDDSRSRKNETYYTEYYTVVKTTGGKTKKIKEDDRGRNFAWDYLKIGDRFRFHPQFEFPYELYDKASAPHIFCIICQTKNPIDADRCKRCHTPLIK